MVADSFEPLISSIGSPSEAFPHPAQPVSSAHAWFKAFELLLEKMRSISPFLTEDIRLSLHSWQLSGEQSAYITFLSEISNYSTSINFQNLTIV